MAAESVKEVFESYLPNRFKEKPDVVAKINSTYKFVLSGDDGGTWIADLTDGGVIAEGDGDAACTVTMTSENFLKMMNGKLNAQMAFMTGKLKVSGDMGLALKLQSILG